MSSATACVSTCPADPRSRCDLLLGLDGVHVEHVERGPTSLTVTISTTWQLMGCPACGMRLITMDVWTGWSDSLRGVAVCVAGARMAPAGWV